MKPEIRRDEARFWREFEEARPRILRCDARCRHCGTYEKLRAVRWPSSLATHPPAVEVDRPHGSWPGLRWPAFALGLVLARIFQLRMHIADPLIELRPYESGCVQRHVERDNDAAPSCRIPGMLARHNLPPREEPPDHRLQAGAGKLEVLFDLGLHRSGPTRRSRAPCSLL
jgi:hypothetical protein